MNYSGMQIDILELFEEAQRAIIDRARAVVDWSYDLGRIVEKKSALLGPAMSNAEKLKRWRSANRKTYVAQLGERNKQRRSLKLTDPAKYRAQLDRRNALKRAARRAA